MDNGPPASGWRQLCPLVRHSRCVSRPEGQRLTALQAALKHLRMGDVLVVHSMDWLARSLFDLLVLVKDLTGRGVGVEFVKEGLSFIGDDSPMSKLMLAVMGGAAEFERDMIRERQREGIAIAKAKGKHLGRAAILKPAQVKELRKRVAAGEDKAQVAQAFGISRASVYNYARAERGR